MRKIFAYILFITAITALGGVAGIWARPELTAPDGLKKEPTDKIEIFKFPEPFVLPLIRGGRVEGTIIISIAIEINENNTSEIKKQEPKIRDAILSMLLNHANAGYFREVFTDENKLLALKTNINNTAREAIANRAIIQTLITDISRRDL